MKFYLTLASIILLVSCSKKDDDQLPPPAEPKHPTMQYIDLQNKEVTSQKGQVIDIDVDGRNDFLFSATLIGDPIGGVDKLRFSAYSGIYSSLFVSENNVSPVLVKDDKITKQNKSPFEWYVLSEVELTEKIIGYDIPPYWQGEWKNASHRYFAIQVTRDGQKYNGWIELSVDTSNDKIILHRTGISIEPDKDVKAGN